MMPLPLHLQNIAVPRSTEIDEEPLEAEVRCPCGSNNFELFYPGHTHEFQGETVPCTAEIDNKFFFLIVARCASCKTEHLVFDKDFHGWDGFVCHNETQALLPRPPLKLWSCPSCEKTVYIVSLEIQGEGKEDFVASFAMSAGDLDAERWPDAFGNIGISIKCISCNKETPDWVSYETM